DTSLSGLAWWALAIIAWDFCYYWSHRVGHEVSVFWAGHAVHHQSEDYNLSTALRQPSTGFLLSWVFFLPLFVLGFPLEILITVNAINLIYQFWVHTQLIDKLGVLDGILVTPSNHRVHHAQNTRYIDRNYGGMLIIWDRLFGTFQAELDNEPPIYGVRRPLNSWNPFWANLKVYADLLSDSVRTRAWRDKYRVWFARTGWRPDDVALRYPASHSDLDHFQKYDPVQSPGVRVYLALQCVAIIAATLWVGLLYVESGLAGVVWPCVAIWFALWALGSINDGQASGRWLEPGRLLLTAGAAWLTDTHVVVVESYAAASLLSFFLLCYLFKKQEIMKETSNNNEMHA
ncbi:MAG: sterol desaturase family protein, partial [Pseudomonadota bacterium]